MSPSSLSDPLSWSALLRVFGTLAVVLLVFVAVLRGLRRVRLGGGRAPHGAMRVVGSLALSPRERLLLVQVGAQQLLIGSSAQGLNCLHVLPEPISTDVPSGSAPAAMLQANFADWLRRARGQGGEGGK